MSHFFYDFTKPGAFDISNGATTVTLSSVQHLVDKCVCATCVNIRAAKRAEAEKAKKIAPPPPPPVTHCCHAHHHHHHHRLPCGCNWC